jgi:hypothetical protein
MFGDVHHQASSQKMHILASGEKVGNGVTITVCCEAI